MGIRDAITAIKNWWSSTGKRQAQESRRPKVQTAKLEELHYSQHVLTIGKSAPSEQDAARFLLGARAYVDSDWVRAIQWSYLLELPVMKVWFKSGYACTVLDVSRGEAYSFFMSGSKGGWYHANVLGPGYMQLRPQDRRGKALKRWIDGV